MVPPTTALAADTATGAPAGSNFERFLKLQDIKVEDIELNRAGKVSPRQVEIAAKHRGRTSSYLFIGFGMGFLAALYVAYTFYKQNHKPMYFLAPLGMLVLGGIAYGIYAAVWRFPLLEGKEVKLVEGRAERVRFLATRDEFDVLMNGVLYKGFGRINHDFDDVRLKMYVVPDRNIIVGIEPPDDSKQ